MTQSTQGTRGRIVAAMQDHLDRLLATPLPGAGEHVVATEDGTMLLVEAPEGRRLGGYPTTDASPRPFATDSIAAAERARDRAQLELDNRLAPDPATELAAALGTAFRRPADFGAAHGGAAVEWAALVIMPARDVREASIAETRLLLRRMSTPQAAE